MDEGLKEALLENAIFAALDEDAFDTLCSKVKIIDHDPGDIILHEGDKSEHLFALLSGIVGVFYSSIDGDNVLVKIFGSPAVFGEMELVFKQPRQEYVEAFEKSRVARFPAEPFMKAMQAQKEACYIAFKDVSARLCIAAYHERALAFLDAPTRLAGLLVSFACAYGEDAPFDDKNQGVRLKFKLTNDMLARCLAVTTRSIERAMKDWRGEGWIKKDKGFLIVRSLDELEDRADPERLALFSTLGIDPHER